MSCRRRCRKGSIAPLRQLLVGMAFFSATAYLLNIATLRATEVIHPIVERGANTHDYQSPPKSEAPQLSG